MAAQPNLEIERARSATELIGVTFSLYRRYPWLFLVLAGMVVVPYQAIDSLVALKIIHGTAYGLLGLALAVGDLALVVPLVSAFHIYAVDDARQGRRPEIASVARRGAERLSVVSPAVFLTWLGTTAGFVALIVPGIFLLLRWAVVAQTASLDAGSWSDALSQSRHLTYGRYRHVFAVLLIVFIVTEIPFLALFPIFGFRTTALAPFLIRSLLSVLTTSFIALATAMLYFDLKARPQTSPVTKLPPKLGPDTKASALPTTRPDGHPLDPASWSDADRPAGWYVDPRAPWVMRYWHAGVDGGGWGDRTSKTPKETLAAWRDLRHVRDQEERSAGAD